MSGTRAALGIAAAVVVGAAALSGGSRSDPRTPSGLPGLPPPFLGVAVVGSGGASGAVDAYGTLVDLRPTGPAGEASIEIPPERVAAGTVPADSGRVARIAVGGERLPLWRADSVVQRYLSGTNALWTVARRGGRTETTMSAIGGLAAIHADRRWIARAKPLASGTPPWARRLHERSLLVLRALTDRRTGAVAAGARPGWAYVWPRDAAAVAIALASAGYRTEARRVVRFLLRLDLEEAARFDGGGEPVPGRAAQGDAAGWVTAAGRAAGIDVHLPPTEWRDRADYQEKSPGDHLANAIASADAPQPSKSRTSQSRRRRSEAIGAQFGTPRGLARTGEAAAGLDSAAAWAVRPFPQPALFPAARRTLLHLAATSGRFGIAPSQDWPDADPWTAPTAWSAWSLAALGERQAALKLMATLRRAATPLGTLPERVDLETGMPRSTTPLAWSHAFAILAIRELWGRAAS